MARCRGPGPGGGRSGGGDLAPPNPGKSDRRARSVGAGKREKAAEEAPTTCRRLFRELFAARRRAGSRSRPIPVGRPRGRDLARCRRREPWRRSRTAPACGRALLEVHLGPRSAARPQEHDPLVPQAAAPGHVGVAAGERAPDAGGVLDLPSHEPVALRPGRHVTPPPPAARAARLRHGGRGSFPVGGDVGDHPLLGVIAESAQNCPLRTVAYACCQLSRFGNRVVQRQTPFLAVGGPSRAETAICASS